MALPKSYVIGVRPSRLNDRQRDRITHALLPRNFSGAQLDRFFALIELGIASYIAHASIQEGAHKVAAIKKFRKLQKQTDEVLNAIVEMDEAKKWIIRGHEPPFFSPSGDHVTPSTPATSMTATASALRGFFNVLTAAIREVKSQPGGRPQDIARRVLAFRVAEAVRDGLGCFPTLTRNGIYQRALGAVMQVTGTELGRKQGSRSRDLMALAKHGIQLLRAESPNG